MTDITGRDGYIISKSLITNIEVNRFLPPHLQDHDAADMEKLLHVYARNPDWRRLMEMSVRSTLRLPLPVLRIR